ncbi:PREDICTED: homeobox protein LUMINIDEPENDENS [Tarenaya hassleriana]|uniref:homeobox protein LUMINIDEPENDENS n=1 Tax=Tarenaya hassleriana TaxID=28532 RepID=UPI00053C5ABB|nr:PREDICTED: homeobox protein LUMINIDEPENDENS [Tarenaya hassleriana]
MDAFKEEIEIGSSAESLMGLLNSQRELFHSQVDQLQDFVVTQCKLTGVNPLAKEMAAGALSIKIGKRPRDLLNPKAIKYMQEVFSIKDAISKKESREISALFGITVSQVREFFVSQKTRVRRQARLSREKAIRSSTHTEQQDGVPENSNAILPIDPVPLNSASTSALAISLDPVPLNSVGPTNNGGDSLAIMSPNDIPSGISDSDKHFVENIFPLMCKEETFSGQVKLMEWILQIQNNSVLIWFLLRGGVMILTTWLSQAATEEQTSVLLLILKVLCHLPLHKASPENMSAILQSVNGLRFYRISDISNRARVLLSRWTKLFAKIQAMEKQNRTNSNINVQSQMLLKQSIEEIMGDGSNIEEFMNPSNRSSETIRRLESSQTPKLLLPSADDSAKKHMLGPSSSYNRERRKVQLVEQPGQKAAGRSPQPLRTSTTNQSRPMSADDIQKAKMRALYMQGKHGKKDSSPGANGETKAATPERPLSLQSAKDSPSHQNNEAETGGTIEPSVVQPVNPSAVNLFQRADDYKKPSLVSQNISNKPEAVADLKLRMNPQAILKNCKRIQIAWHVPPEIKLDDLWRVAAGGSSKEVDVQRNRNRREKETIYQSLQQIPLNPKEPWDREMDHDDSLTPEIPSQQPPEENITEPQDALDERRIAAVSATTSSAQSGTLEPDLELLAVLLKNPELVFALTSGKSGNFPGQDMVKLLDMIKSAGPSSAGSSSMESSNKLEEKVEVSLPSPTPSTNPGMSGWRPGMIQNPFSKQNPGGSAVSRSVSQAPGASMQWQAEQSNQRYVSSAYNTSSPSPQTTSIISEKHHQLQHRSTVSTTMERQQIPPLQQQNFHLNPQLQQNISGNPSIGYPSKEPMGTASDSWRAQANRSIYYSHEPNNGASFHGGGHAQAPSYTVNRNTSNPGYESWSPEHSPTGRNHPNGYWDQNNRRWRH